MRKANLSGLLFNSKSWPNKRPPGLANASLAQMWRVAGACTWQGLGLPGRWTAPWKVVGHAQELQHTGPHIHRSTAYQAKHVSTVPSFGRRTGGGWRGGWWGGGQSKCRLLSLSLLSRLAITAASKGAALYVSLRQKRARSGGSVG